MYEYEHRDRFYLDNMDKQKVISFGLNEEDSGYDPEGDNVVYLTNNEIVDNTFEYYDGITDAQSLTFQNCISDYIKFTTRYVENSLYGKWLYVQDIIGGDTENPIPIGNFIVVTDNVSIDGKIQEIIAYDALSLLINCPMSGIKNIYDDLDFPVSVRDLRDRLFDEFSIEQEEISLINDDIMLPKQLSDEDFVSGSDFVKFIAEINGVFPHIGKDGILHWISLDTGDINEGALYPSLSTYPGYTSYPGNGYSGKYAELTKNQYKQGTAIWANYLTLRPDGVQIRNESNNIAYWHQDGGSDNPYIIINNFLLYGLSSGQYEQIAKRLYKKIHAIEYYPFEMIKMADPCIEPGDRVMVYTEQDTILPSYVFSKHTTGIMVPWEDISTQGTYELGEYDVNKNASTNAKLKNLDNRVGNIEKSGSGPLQIQSVAELPDNPQLNVLYLIQGTVRVE